MERLWHRIRLNAEKGFINFNDEWPDNEGCSGHHSTDVTPFRNLFDDSNTFYSNADLYELLSPSVVPYMYEDLKWPHCDLLGYEMSGLDS